MNLLKFMRATSSRLFQLLPLAVLVLFVGYRIGSFLPAGSNGVSADKKSGFMSYTCDTDVPEGSLSQVATSGNEPRMSMPAELKHGIVSIAIDDGWNSSYEIARPLLKQFDFRASYYIVSEFSVDQQPGYMSMEKVKQLSSEGHEIGSHSIRHCDMTHLTDDQLNYDAKTSKNVLAEQGLDIKSFAYPYGSHDGRTMAELSQHYQFLRTSDVGYNDRHFNRLNIKMQSVESHTSNYHLQSWLDTAKEEKRWLVLTYHRFNENGDYNISATQLYKQLEAIKQSGLEVLPLSEAAQRIIDGRDI